MIPSLGRAWYRATNFLADTHAALVRVAQAHREKRGRRAAFVHEQWHGDPLRAGAMAAQSAVPHMLVLRQR